MVTKKIFGLIGGDFRQIYLAKKFIDDGNKVFLCGFDKLKLSDDFLYSADTYDTVTQSDYIVLPLPPTRDGIYINAPLSKNKISIGSQTLSLLHKKIVFGDLTKLTGNTDKYKTYDYSKSEEFQIMNSIPSAEGALKTALNMKNQTFFKSQCLISGFGRIGKILANRLSKFNADITVAARNNTDLTWAYALGYDTININNVSDKLTNCDFIFNTVPHMIFDKKTLSKCNKDTLIIDLASPPGGIDQAAAKELNINYSHELCIPGKMFPKTAANIIYYSIKKIIEEETI